MIKVQKPGLFTTVQDMGRFGYRNIGVPVSGVMDVCSATLGNRLLNNDSRAALLEITMAGPQLQFTAATHIVITGALMQAAINGVSIPNNRVIRVQQGDVLSFGRPERGIRAYMAVKGGIKSALIMNSQSYYFPLTNFAHLQKGQELDCEVFDGNINDLIEIKPNNDFLFSSAITVYAGPEYEMLNREEKELLKQTFSVSTLNNRMAYQLEEQLPPNNYSIITSGTLPGTVQLTPSGRLIVLMKDCQTTGGYPRVLQLSVSGICTLAQKKYGDRIVFKME
ncbi:5-oxoprolinase subunit C family protein [Sinomicrobium sp.]